MYFWHLGFVIESSGIQQPCKKSSSPGSAAAANVDGLLGYFHSMPATFLGGDATVLASPYSEIYITIQVSLSQLPASGS